LLTSHEEQWICSVLGTLVAAFLAIFFHPYSIFAIAISFLDKISTISVFVMTITHKAAPWTIHFHPHRIFLAFFHLCPLFTACSFIDILACTNTAALHAVLSHPGKVLRILLAQPIVHPTLALLG